MKSLAVVLFLCCIQFTPGISSPLDTLDGEQANDFHGQRTRRAYKTLAGLNHECYDEGCEYHEVAECFENKEKADNYWHDYQCWKGKLEYCAVCVYRQDCSFGNWESWSNTVAPSDTYGCVKQIRSKPYRYGIQTAYKKKSEKCKGLHTSCPPQPSQSRDYCYCKKALCKEGSWSAWQGAVPEDSCVTQTRQKPYHVTYEAQQQEGSCNTITDKCNAPVTDTRRMCSCSYREDCTLKEWQAWTGVVPDNGCVNQIRTRDYNNSVIYLRRESCEELSSCPVIRDETRTKCNCNKIICNWGNWSRTGYNADTNCWTESRVKNVSSGFEKVQQMDSCDDLPKECDNNEVEKRQDCQSGGDHIIVTSPAPIPTQPTVPPTDGPATFVRIGCFRDDETESKKQGDVRPLPHLYLNLRSEINWKDWSSPDFLSDLVQKCAEKAKELRYEYFSVQHWGECWGGNDLSAAQYARDGVSTNCYNDRVGMDWANMVYRLQDMPACSGELEFNQTKVSSGSIEHSVWCAKDVVNSQWITVKLKDDAKKIKGVGSLGHNKDSLVTLYQVEYSEEGKTWTPYSEHKEPKVFPGNSDQFTLEIHWLAKPINARFLRFKPISWVSTSICMNIKVYGCAV